jgi:hypothetical protein
MAMLDELTTEEGEGEAVEGPGSTEESAAT